jgi:beta-glucosidase-like glycosyl hydrolase
MTVEEKIGQMICCRYWGRFFSRENDTFKTLKTLTTEQKIGGFILFGGDVYETAFLTNSLQELAETPLLMASDLERGLGNQITGATLFPPLMSIGAGKSEEIAYQMGKITALEARSIGIHVTYAPVVDVNINPDNPIINVRSIGEDPELVSRISVAFIKGCQENGLMATAKHFPGHGDTELDSHSVLPTVDQDMDRLRNVELYPFKKAVEAGVETIMTAHIRFPALDPTPGLPATLSAKVLTDLLRKEMGFKGIIVSDAMDMGGVTSIFSSEEAALRAVKAGIDMVLLPPKPKEVIQALVEAVKTGEISERRIDASVKRILEAKARLGLHREKLVDLNLLAEKIGKKENLLQAEKAFENSITLVKNEGKIVPLSAPFNKLAVFSLSSDPGGYFAGRTFVQEMKKRSFKVIDFYADPFTGKEFFDKAVEDAKEAEVLVVALFSRLRDRKGSVGLDPNHMQFLEDRAKEDKPILVISFGSPYLLKGFPEVDAYIAAYRHANQAQAAAVKAIFGEIDVIGKLPVSIPELFPLGHGIQIKKRDKILGIFNRKAFH